jgi:hypothetical protein
VFVTAHRVLSTADAEDYLLIMSCFLGRLARARSMVDVNIAAGVAEQELEEFQEKVLDPEAPGLWGKMGASPASTS